MSIEKDAENAPLLAPAVEESEDIKLCCFLTVEQLSEFTNRARDDLNAIRKRKLEDQDTKFRLEKIDFNNCYCIKN